MIFFNWNDSLSVGNEVFDDDHKNLIKLVDKLNEALKSGESKAALADIFDELIKYTKEHFKREEDLMQRIGYAEFKMHKEAHERLISAIEDCQKNFESGDTILDDQMPIFLFDWLFNHILLVDKKLSWAVQQFKSGQ